MKKNKKSLWLIVLLLLVGLTGGYVASTYAKYTSSVDKEGTVTVAKWAFADDNANSELEIDFTNTYHASTLVNDRIAPGTSGSFYIQVVNGTSETGVDFTLNIKSIENVPTNLKFYSDSSFSSPMTLNDGAITGQLKAGDATGVKVPLYWKWEYETLDSNNSSATGDGNDTTDGVNANSLNVTVSITGVQTPPSETEITSHIN